MITINTEAALRNFRSGRPKSTWAAKGPGATEDATEMVKPGMGGGRVYGSDLDLQILPKFTVSRNDTFFAVGSCFARNLELALNAQNFKVNSWRPSMPVRPWFFNRYN